MKLIKLSLFSTAILGLMVVSCSSGLTAKSSGADTVSYAFGINIGESLKKSKVEGLTPSIIAKGIADVLEKDGSDAKLTYEESMDILQKYFTQLQSQTLEKNGKTGSDFLANNKTAEGVVELPSGLQYKIISAGTGPKPAASDMVRVHYKGTFINGEVFDSSYERGEPIDFQLDQVIKGWTEGLQQINEGSKAMLYIPADLGYGMQGTGRIEPNTTLIFEIDLIAVNPKD